MKGILHVHSTYSPDGRHSIEEIGAYARAKGYSFVCVSDHSDLFTQKLMDGLSKECRRASTKDCVVIPGIEFNCSNKMHLVGMGIREFTDKKELPEITDFITRKGGVAVLAHPARYGFSVPGEYAKKLHGLEAWSQSYDGRFLPNPRCLRLVESLQRVNGSLLSFGGTDLHRISASRFNVETHMQINGNKPDEKKIISALKKGDFFISNPYLRLNAKGSNAGAFRFAGLKAARAFYDMAKGLRAAAGR